MSSIDFAFQIYILNLSGHDMNVFNLILEYSDCDDIDADRVDQSRNVADDAIKNEICVFAVPHM